MAMSPPDVPAVLASDADRDAAARQLNDGFAAGRLTAAEHSDRVHAVYAARTWLELARLTADLPAPAELPGAADLPGATQLPGGAELPGAAELAVGRAEPDWMDRLNPCLLCLLLCLCPPAGVAVLWRRRRARAGTGRRAEDR
jgi:hypothetical protein